MKAFFLSAPVLRESACPLHPQISNSRRRSLLLSLCFSLSSYLLYTPWGLVFCFCVFFGPCFLLFLGCFLVVVVVGEVLGFELVLCVLSSFVAFSL
jgi:hypothetical protein